GASVAGKFYCASMFHVDGEHNGLVLSESIEVIGKNGNLIGELKADKIVVNGCFEGDLEADRLGILAGGVVSGNVSIKVLAIESG
ncbi:bactofilin family protein, partial [Campylobacter coli]|uniref:bactofilin family protein n=1 Tax=Campylobacter coli TaxID=195 RepID=UPI0015CF7DAF